MTFQKRVKEWLLQCFGAEVAADKQERNWRFLEEALELVQACECTKEDAHALVEYVYNRPVGETRQEIGGVMVTLAALCETHHYDMLWAGQDELDRIEKPDVIVKIREKQRSKSLRNTEKALP